MLKRFAVATAAAALGATAVATTADAARPTIVTRAVEANNATGAFDTLLAAATCDYFHGAIVQALSGKSQLTLFAPTDDAFAKLSLDAGNVCDAFAADPGALQNILLYHVTSGRRSADWLADRVGTSITMANGDPAAITATDAGLGLAVDGAAVVIADVAASNGFIHAVDSVLLPPS